MMVNRLTITRRPISKCHIPLLTVAFLAAYIAGCSSPGVKLYTLSPTAVNALSVEGGGEELAVSVGPSELPRELERAQMVTRSGANRLKVDQFNIWASSLQIDFDRTLAENLGTLLNSKQVVGYPSPPRFPIDYRVLVNVHRFDGTLGKTLTLRGDWNVFREADVVSIQSFNISQPVDGRSYEDLAAAHSAAIGKLSEQIANGLIALPAATQ